MIRDALLLATVVALAGGARSFLPSDATVTGSGATLAVGFVVLAALYTGRVFHRLKLPHLTGFLLCGALLGPAVGGVLTDAMLDDLSVVKRVAVGLIALVAGCEINLRALRPRLGRIGALAIGGLAAAWIGLFAYFWGAVPHLEETAELIGAQRGTVALVLATVICALSPAVVIGLLTETRSAGPLSETALSIVVLADLGIIVAFTAANAVADQVFGLAGATGAGGVGSLVAHLGGSIAAGGVLGVVLAVYVARVGVRIGLFVFCALFVVAEGAYGLDPLLVGLTTGLVLENATPVGGARVIHHTEYATIPVFALFFGVVGAEIHLRHFVETAGWALIAAGVRFSGFVAGTRIGGRMGGVDPGLTRLVPFGMIPQAGVALALADLLSRSPHPWARGVAPLVFGTIVVNELVGPVVFRAALASAAEIGKKPMLADVTGAEDEDITFDEDATEDATREEDATRDEPTRDEPTNGDDGTSEEAAG